MAVKIRLKRLGKRKNPQYRIVVVDAHKKRDGRVLEEIGTYQPKENPSYIDVASERAQYWLGVGAQPTETVESILKTTGDWHRAKGIDGPQRTLQEPKAKRDKLAIFNEALKEAGGEPSGEAVTKAKSGNKAARTTEQGGADPGEKAQTGEPTDKAKTTEGAGDEQAPSDIAVPEDEKPGEAAEEAVPGDNPSQQSDPTR